MNSIQIISVLQQDPHSMAARVISRDQLPNPYCTGSFIMNTDPSHLPGRHWVAIYSPTNGPIEFVDSLGYSPEHYQINQWSSYKYNCRRLQPYQSNFCAFYCLYFIINRCNGLTLEQIMNEFGEDLHENDRIVSDFVHQFHVPPHF